MTFKKNSILKLLNKFKEGHSYPQALEFCNITSIWKWKGSQNIIDNYQGIIMDARCTLKTESGTSRRINIKKNSDPRICVGQPILHTSMDNLGQMSYEDEKLLYRYKGIVAVPSICMVDDIWSIQRSQVNAVISAFIEI